MSQEAWDAWIDYHALLAGRKDEGDFAMMSGWARLLSRQGFTPEQLRAATDAVFLGGSPKWFPDHLQEIIKFLRRPRPAAPAAGGPKGPICLLCGGSGLATVPDPDRLDERKTCAVYCRCPAGRCMRMTTPEVKQRGVMCRVVTLEEYEYGFPDWRDYPAIWTEQMREEFEEVAKAEKRDRSLGPLAPTAFRDALAKLKGAVTP